MPIDPQVKRPVNPALPIPPMEYSSGAFAQLNNVLRLHLNSLTAAVRYIMNTGYNDKVSALGSLGGGSVTWNVENGDVLSATVDTAATTVTINTTATTGRVCTFRVYLTNGGSQTLNFNSTVMPGGAIAFTTSGVDLLEVSTIDAGTTWYMTPLGLDYS